MGRFMDVVWNPGKPQGIPKGFLREEFHFGEFFFLIRMGNLCVSETMLKGGRGDGISQTPFSIDSDTII